MLSNLTGLESLQTVRGALTGELSALLPLTGPAGLGTYEAGVWTGLGLTARNERLDGKRFAHASVLSLYFASRCGAGLVLQLICSGKFQIKAEWRSCLIPRTRACG